MPDQIISLKQKCNLLTDVRKFLQHFERILLECDTKNLPKAFHFQIQISFRLCENRIQSF